MNRRLLSAAAAASALLAAIWGCATGAGRPLPQLGEATGASLTPCADLATRLSFANTTISAANLVAAGTLSVAGSPVPAHCQVLGKMNARVSAVDSGATAMIWQVPPQSPAGFSGATFALTGNLDSMLAKINASNATYVETALALMTPPNPGDLSRLRNRGAKLMAYHGTSDPIFSSDDTTAWYETLGANHNGDASNFARFFRVPGMTHCSGGPATDQFDMLTPLVNWVEKGQAPDSVVATARGLGNAAGANVDVPAAWSVARTRPLCSYPKVARYKGSGSIDTADNFACQ